MILTQPTPFYHPQFISGKYANQPHSKPDSALPKGTEVSVLKYDWDGTQEPEKRQFWAFVQYPVREAVIDGAEARFAWVESESLKLESE